MKLFPLHMLAHGRHRRPRPAAPGRARLSASAATTLLVLTLAGSAYALPASAATTAHAWQWQRTYQWQRIYYHPRYYHPSYQYRVMAVRDGDTLSGMAVRYCGTRHAADWTGIYAANYHAIGKDPGYIRPGQRLLMPRCRYVPWAARMTAPPAYTPAWTPRTYAPAATTARVAYTPPPSGGYTVNSSFQACVIARESGGNAQVMNASGHYGLYQFAAQTWQAYGGSPAAFGNASPAYQTQIFDNAIARGGQSNWSTYDGC